MGVVVHTRARAVLSGLAVALTVPLTVGGCASSDRAALASDSPSPVQTSTPLPTASPTPSFADGAVFDEDCAIAWPTEPVVSAENIQLTLTCQKVPSSLYVFVVAVYDDPTLAVTPANTRVHVTGTVSDTALTNTGLSYLIVAATAISL
ncbi:hypothetical protein BH11ACT2_BH11ACT2_09040 [soil metagenome]